MAPSTLLHFDQSRSGGTLLQRILSDQPNRHFLGHPFSSARGKQVEWLVGGNVAEGMNEGLREDFDRGVQKGIKAWEDGSKEALEAGKVLMIQDHCFNPSPPEVVQRLLKLVEEGETGPDEGENVTQLPARLLLQPGLVPLFTIRDPRLAVPSAYRVLKKFGLQGGGGRAMFSGSTNPIWIRLLYNWFRAHGVEPVIVDCDDIQTAASTDFLQRLCGKLDLDREKIRLSWPRISDEEREKTHPSFYASQSTLLESEGVNAGLAGRNRDMAKEVEGWEEAFGGDVGLVRRAVEGANVHYAWLMERRFR